MNSNINGTFIANFIRLLLVGLTRRNYAIYRQTHSLDTVRAAAMLLGILFHGAMPYFQGIKGYYVCVDTPSVALAAFGYIIHIFRMSLFFLMAGFFGHMIIERRDTKAFIKDRLKRILLPLLVGYPVIMTLVVVAYILGCLTGGTAPQCSLKALQRGSGSIGFTWGHLWFLYHYLVRFTFIGTTLNGRRHPRVQLQTSDCSREFQTGTAG